MNKLPPVIGFTSGTTLGYGKVINYWEDDYIETIIFREWSLEGIQRDDYHLTVTMSNRSGLRKSVAMHDNNGWNGLWFPHHPKHVPTIVQAIKEYRPVIFNVMSNPLMMAFEKYFEEHDDCPIDVFSSFNYVQFGGEPIIERYSRLLATWGACERNVTTIGDYHVAHECIHGDGFHIHDDLLDIKTTAGEMTVTTLYDTPEPLVNHKTGDYIEINDECPCGYKTFRILGRKAQEIIINNRRLFPSNVSNIITTINETRAGVFQIIKPKSNKDNCLCINIGYEEDLLKRSLSELRQELTTELDKGLEIPIVINLMRVDDIKNISPIKVRRVIDG